MLGHEPPRRTIVVGYDGSPASRAAVEHAITLTRPDGHLVVVHAFPLPDGYTAVPFYDAVVTRAREDASAVVDELERDCRALHHVDYEIDVLPGRPADVVCTVAEHRRAEQVVVGSRGAGRVSALLGSVAHEVLHQAHCPVLVIPRRMLDDEPREAPMAVLATS